MIKVQGNLSRSLFLACSGGIDSMAALDFLSHNHTINIAFFDHNTPTSKQALEFVSKQCKDYKCGFTYGKITRERKPRESQEEYWRNERYKFFNTLPGQVVTGHHLDDCVETWVWSSMHGTGKIIPHINKNVIRPFRLNKKKDLKLWCELKSVPFLEDTTNKDITFTRNYIRHKLMPHALTVNPGLHKVIKKKVISDVRTKRTIYNI